MEAMDGIDDWKQAARIRWNGPRAGTGNTATGGARTIGLIAGLVFLIGAAGLLSASRAGADVAIGGSPPSVDGTLTLPGIDLRGVDVLGPSTAIVRAGVDPRGVQTNFYVEYGTGGVLNQRTPNLAIAAGAGPVPAAAELLGLLPSTVYDYRVVVQTPTGSAVTGLGTFSTPDALVVSLASGRVTPGGASSAGKHVSCTIVGTAGNDRLVGTSKKDVICGLGGNDTITARGGNDTVVGGSGRDRVSGGNGRDRIRGNSGADRLNGNAGADRLYGGSGRDKLTGAGGNDYLVGNGDKDLVRGSGGNDRLIASQDHHSGDRVYGGPGRDRAVVNRGDRVHGVERTSRRR